MKGSESYTAQTKMGACQSAGKTPARRTVGVHVVFIVDKQAENIAFALNEAFGHKHPCNVAYRPTSLCVNANALICGNKPPYCHVIVSEVDWQHVGEKKPADIKLRVYVLSTPGAVSKAVELQQATKDTSVFHYYLPLAETEISDRLKPFISKPASIADLETHPEILREALDRFLSLHVYV